MHVVANGTVSAQLDVQHHNTKGTYL
jgi:hypothetical protein